ncbi:MAG: 4a-hydroxytetrahydrobiopterin dehydratase [Halobacteriales archaeon]|jgi:4a-hydroxytetrahydrobiopterin dehydratase
MSDLLSEDEIKSQLPDGWTYGENEIGRIYEFDDYLRGVNFAQLVGEIAEVQGHHPTMVIGYKELKVTLSTHEAGGVTEKDLEMAEVIEAERND